MKAAMPLRSRGPLVCLAGLWLSALSVKADPIVGPDIPIFEPGTMFAFTAAILIEALFISLFFQRSRAPRFFILWLVGMHLVSYPLFLGVVQLCAGMDSDLPELIGEVAIVVIEGGLIFLLCRFAPGAKPELPMPSVGKTLLASLVGNIASAVAFPMLMVFGEVIGSLFGLSARE